MAKPPAKSDGRYGERLLKQRKDVAAEFGIADITDWRVRRLALLQAQFAAAEDQIADGRLIDIGEVLALDKAIQDIRQALRADEPCNISVHFVKTITGICPKCHARIEDYKAPEPPPAPPPAPPENVYARPVDEARPAVGPPSGGPSASKDAPQENQTKTTLEEPKTATVVPMTTRPGISPSGFHDQRFGSGEVPPLKKLQPSLYATRNVSPMSNGKG